MSLTDRMTCPRCAASEISTVTGKCYLCGFAIEAGVAVESTEAISELATRQLAHEFKFGDLIGTGRDSAVFHAREGTGNRDVVVKAILRKNDDSDSADTFRATMTAFAALDHPNLVSILRFGSTDSVFWSATEDRQATSLRARLVRHGRQELREVRRVITQLAGVLDFLHRRGLVHGAVHSGNVLVDARGWVGLTDPNFMRPRRASIAVIEPDGTALPPLDPVVRFEPGIAPEEQSRGERTAAADQFCLAAIAYECLTGRPYDGAPPPLAALRPELPPGLCRAIERALDVTPAFRYASCGELLQALDEDAVVHPAVRPARMTADVVMVADWTPPGSERTLVWRAARIGGVVLALLLVGAAGVSLLDLLRAAPVKVVEAVAQASNPAASPQVTVPASAPSTTVRVPPPLRPNGRPASQSAAATNRPRADAAAVTTPAATARVSVNSTPWGEVFIDGVSVGNTPRANIPVTPGSHVILVARPGFEPWERRVRIAPTDSLRFTDIVLSPVAP